VIQKIRISDKEGDMSMVNRPAVITNSASFVTLSSLFGSVSPYIDQLLLHFHGGLNSPISWNDKMDAELWNTYISAVGGDRKTPVPVIPTEGYNKHYHTSEFDGGMLPGIMNVHDHRDNYNGGFAFAVFAPATPLPMISWD
jgi:hypothetical protein